MKTNKLIALIGISIYGSVLFGQGCSDAGFCSVNRAFLSDTDTVRMPYEIGLSISTGSADRSIQVWGSNLNLSYSPSEKLQLEARISALQQEGNGVLSRGISDLMLISNYRITSDLVWVAGLKIPFSDAGKKENDVFLPMDYQASLGTFDAILGAAYAIGDLKLNAAVQVPFIQNNNQFRPAEWTDNDKLQKFQETYNFKRSSDVLLRISYPVIKRSGFELMPGILNIYHMDNDRYTNADGQELSIDGSKGLTINGNMHAGYSLNARNKLQLTLASPFIVRKARPDGLTRSWLAALEYRVKF